MAKNKISEWSSLASNNTDVGGIDIAEGCAPSGINNAIREVMAQVKDMVTGADGDSQTIGGNLSVTGTSTLSGAVTAPAGITGNLIGTVTGNVTGNAGTVTNGVYTIGNQSIAGTKTFSSSILGNLTGNVTGNVTGTVTGNVTGNSGTVTNGVYTTGNQTIAGTKTFSSSILGNLTGNVTGNLTGNLVATAPTAPTASFGVNTTQIATTAFVQTALAALHPVGSIYIAVISTNPATLFGFGAWVAFGAGKVLVGLNGADASFDTVEETGGSKDAAVVAHTHTATSTVTDSGHFHTYQTGYQNGVAIQGSNGIFGGGTPDDTSYIYNSQTKTTGITVATTNDSTGVSGTNANLQPYIVVYMWKRTA